MLLAVLLSSLVGQVSCSFLAPSQPSGALKTDPERSRSSAPKSHSPYAAITEIDAAFDGPDEHWDLTVEKAGSVEVRMWNGSVRAANLSQVEWKSLVAEAELCKLLDLKSQQCVLSMHGRWRRGVTLRSANVVVHQLWRDPEQDARVEDAFNRFWAILNDKKQTLFSTQK